MKDVAPQDRPREKLERLGVPGLGDNELVALVLGSGSRDAGALDLANRLIACAGGVHGLTRIGLDRLRRVSGVGPARAAQVVAAVELGRRTLVSLFQRHMSLKGSWVVDHRRMIVTLHTDRLRTLQHVREFLEGNQEVDLVVATRAAAYGFIEQTLGRFDYVHQGKAEKGLLRCFLAKVTGLSRAQLTRLGGVRNFVCELLPLVSPPA